MLLKFLMMPRSFLIKKTIGSKFLGIILFLYLGTYVGAQTPGRLLGEYEDSEGVLRRGVFDFGDLDLNIVFFLPDGLDKEIIQLKPDQVQQIRGGEDLLVLTHDIQYQVFDQNDDRQMMTERIFLYRINKGPISLYEGFSKKEGILFFLNTVDRSEIRRVNKKATKTFFKNYFKDCANFIKGANSYDRSSILKAVKSAQACAYRYQATELSRSVPNKKGILLGGQLFYFTGKPRLIGAYADGDYQPYHRLGLGVQAQLNLSSRTAVRTGFNYVDKGVSSDSVYYFWDPRNYVFHDPIDIDIKFIEWPISVHYVFGLQKEKISPTMAAGMSFLFPLQQEIATDFTKSKNFIQAPNPPPPYQLEGNFIEMHPLNIRFWVAAGVSRIQADNSRLEFLISYSEDKEVFRNIFSGDDGILTRRLTFSFTYLYMISK